MWLITGYPTKPDCACIYGYDVCSIEKLHISCVEDVPPHLKNSIDSRLTTSYETTAKLNGAEPSVSRAYRVNNRIAHIHICIEFSCGETCSVNTCISKYLVGFRRKELTTARGVVNMYVLVTYTMRLLL